MKVNLPVTDRTWIIEKKARLEKSISERQTSISLAKQMVEYHTFHLTDTELLLKKLVDTYEFD